MYIRPYAVAFISKHNIAPHVNAACVEIEDDGIVFCKAGETVKLPCEAVVMATGARSNTAVADMVRQLDYSHKVIGDANKPARSLKHSGPATRSVRTI
jgi:NADH dehydrogenase FAD-containing subunit